MSRLEAIKQRLANIYYEPWEMDEDSYHIYVLGSSEWVTGDVRDKETGEFIAHAPEDIQWLLDRLETLDRM